MRNAHSRALLPLGLLVFALFAAIALAPRDAAALVVGERDCSNAGQAPSLLTLGQLRREVLCLVNGARETHGLAPLRFNPDLRRSASRHSADMVTEHYFGHDDPRGGGVGERVTKAGYLQRISAYAVGENIGGGPGRRFGSPAAVYREWMHSPPHRANILDPSFRDFGVGVARGFPTGGGGAAATYTLDLGFRH